MLIFAHISDTHLDGAPRALERTRRVMAYLRRLPIDAILVTGDIADRGAAHEYDQARAELIADVPVLMLPGNHDERSAYRTGLLGQAGVAPVNVAPINVAPINVAPINVAPVNIAPINIAPINEARWVGGALFALCDSSIPGRNDGLLSPETLAWLSGTLAATEAPTFVCLHHPPAPLHHPLIDEIRLAQAERLAHLIEASPHVVAVLCGHAHTAAASTFAGRPMLVAPGVASTLRLPWTSAETLSWANTIDFDDPPAVAFHVLADDGRLTTHFRVVAAQPT